MGVGHHGATIVKAYCTIVWYKYGAGATMAYDITIVQFDITIEAP